MKSIIAIGAGIAMGLAALGSGIGPVSYTHLFPSPFPRRPNEPLPPLHHKAPPLVR